MNPPLIIGISCTALFVGSALMPYFGYRIALWQTQKGSALPDSSSVSSVMASLFALLGLLIAFIFSGAFSRFDDRRQIILEEYNHIGTAYLRLDVLSPSAQVPLRQSFLQYTELRADLFETLNNNTRALEALAETEVLQNRIWQLAVVATAEKGYEQNRMLVLPAINDMIDITSKRTVAILTHPPLLILVALCIVAFTCAFLLGYSANTSKRHRLSSAHVMCFATATTFILYVILDVEFPRIGFVTIQQVNQLLVQLSEQMR